MARCIVGVAPGRICGGVPARGPLLVGGTSALGLAADVFHWRLAGIAGDFRSFTCKRVRSVAKNSTRKLGPAWPRDRIALEVIYLYCALDDDDELCLARYSGHVSHAAQAGLALQSTESRSRHGAVDGGGHRRRSLFRSVV